MIWLILLFGLILRLINLNQSLWLDEAINVIYARNLDFISFVSKYPVADFHPPGFFAILWIWTRLFGFSEIAVRMPSVLFAVGTIFLVYLIGKDFFSKKVGLLAALFLSLAPLHIYYSQEARMYSFAAFAAALSIYFLMRLVSRKKYGVLGYALSLVLVLYSDYVTYFILPAQLLYLLMYHRKDFSRYFMALLIGIVSFLPWLFVLPQQFANGQQTASVLTGWKQVVGGSGIKEALLLIIKTVIGRITFDNKIIYFIFAATGLLPFLLLIKYFLAKTDKFTKLLLLCVFLPPTLAFIVSFFIPVFAYFRFIFILPGLYLLLAVALENYDYLNKKIFKFGRLYDLLIAAIFIFEILASLIYLVSPKFHREDWRKVVTFTNDKIAANTAVLVESDNLFSPYLYYSKNNANTYGGLVNIPVKSGSDLANLESYTQGKNNIYILEYLADITDPQRLLEKKIQELGFIKKNIYDFRGVGFVTLYQK